MKKVYYVLAAVFDADVAILLGACGHIFIKSGQTDVAIGTFAMCGGFALALIISILGFFRGLYVPAVLLIKLGLIIFSVFGLVEGVLIAEKEWMTFAFMIFISLFILLICCFFGMKLMRKHDVPRVKMSNERRKFKYSVRDVKNYALLEYFLKKNGRIGVQAVYEEDDFIIGEWAAIPFSYYFLWLLKKGFFDESIFKKIPQYTIDDCKKGKIEPSVLLKKMNNILKGRYLTDEGAAFSLYYLDKKCHLMTDRRLIFDYYGEIKNEEGDFYSIRYSLKTAKNMCKKIEESYWIWKHSVEDGKKSSECEINTLDSKAEEITSVIPMTDDKFDMQTVEKLLAEGKLVKTYAIPPSLGGMTDETNVIFITPEADKIKKDWDMRVEAIKAAYFGGIRANVNEKYKKLTMYDVTLEKYKDNIINVPVRIKTELKNDMLYEKVEELDICVFKVNGETTQENK